MSSAHPEGMTQPKKLDELYGLIEGIETAMFTTRRPNGQLVSRPMATQHRIQDADLWFVTDAETNKLDELALDPHVNCAYYNNKSREWVSVSGVARVSKNRTKIRQLYKEDWKVWSSLAPSG
jgi:general stress protein 26